MTEAAVTIDHSQLEALLREQEALLSAAELHGYLCGQLAVGRRLSRSEWLRQAADLGDFGRHPDQRAGDLLYTLYQQTLAALGSSDLDFQLLLADDDEPLAERLDGLGRWCQGFLTGFGLAGGDAADEETQEALRDIGAIAQVGADEEDTEQNDSDLFAVTEYVRLAVLHLFWQKSPTPPGQQSGSGPVSAPDPAPSVSPASLFQRNKLH